MKFVTHDTSFLSFGVYDLLTFKFYFYCLVLFQFPLNLYYEIIFIRLWYDAVRARTRDFL